MNTPIAKRFEDMTPDGFLEIYQQPDKDIILVVSGRDSSDNPITVSIEFTAIGVQGGNSPRTREALLKLAEAMNKDNKHNP